MSVLTGTWTSNFIIANSIKLHYVTQGSGKLILMLHGFPEFWYSWRHQIPEFASHYKVVALDMRGYNDSDKPREVSAYRPEAVIADIKAVIEALDYEQCILVGHDWGGAIAWGFAYAYPEMVEKLIVLNIPHPAKFKDGLWNLEQLQKSWYIFFFQLPILPELFLQADDYRAIAAAFIDMAIDKSTFSSEDLEAYKDAAARRGALTAMVNYYRNIFQGLLDPNRAEEWGLLRVPTLMIWGEDDQALCRELTYGTDEYVEDFQVRYISACSHWVQQEKPELVNQYIWEFLNESE
ncbi:MAG: alpha/beta hydrolase [Oscillatoriales cyanobacterium RM2_1_1]|nr:alpha/beta hydrolase [Oscillatoriales cyanobacterium SM2_3_0]NJO44376.1 alpha/beta hydrolase [Oscillatoriales cyanobacterium RM2_1_1]